MLCACSGVGAVRLQQENSRQKELQPEGTTGQHAHCNSSRSSLLKEHYKARAQLLRTPSLSYLKHTFSVGPNNLLLTSITKYSSSLDLLQNPEISHEEKLEAHGAITSCSSISEKPDTTTGQAPQENNFVHNL